ncbi:TIGR04540 family protein [Clostridium sp. HCP1S3_B4]|uniref:TIGR04540 family protein n=1 Tax=unclassified Clostridium TaxID=2614128 RepID=UPI002A76BD32|nr:TIGR04540 family protein [Clostridiales bacterium]MDY2729312.1 TIGR04540 family protein [Clostridium sp.]
MRLVYKNPKELGTAVKDLVDEYQDDLITYEKFQEKLKKVSETNKERLFKNGKVESKIAVILGDERIELLNKALA